MAEQAQQAALPAYADPAHPTNKIRPRLRCWGCGTKGVVGKHWGQWCFECNVRRIRHLDARFDEIRAALAKAEGRS